MVNYIQLLRAHQWIKNLFIFVPAFFDQQLTVQACLLVLIPGFFTFSFASSAVYILNDYLDIEDDRKHHKKKHRPLASGRVAISTALSIGVGLLVGGVVIGAFLSWAFAAIITIYLLLNILYTIRLKHVPILDISIVASGYVFRVLAGGILCAIPVSEWLLVITFLLALFIALAKRRDDVLLYQKSGEKTRKVVDGYNLEFLNIAMSIMASVVIVSYLMYTLSADIIERLGTDQLYFTVIFVILGFFRYLQRAFVEENTGSPTEIIYFDRFIQITVLAWMAVMFFLLYFL